MTSGEEVSKLRPGEWVALGQARRKGKGTCRGKSMRVSPRAERWQNFSLEAAVGLEGGAWRKGRIQWDAELIQVAPEAPPPGS